MTTRPLKELSVGLLKALAKRYDISTTGCIDKAELVEVLIGSGVSDDGKGMEPPGDTPAKPQARAEPAAAAPPPPSGPTKIPPKEDFNDLPGGEPRPPPTGGEPPNKTARTGPKPNSLEAMSIGKLKVLAQERKVDISHCLQKDEMISTLKAAGVTEGAQPKTYVEPPKPKPQEPPKPKGPPPPLTEAQKRHAAWLERQKEWQKKEDDKKDMHEGFLMHFKPGTRWEILQGIPLWSAEYNYHKVGFINAKTPAGHATVIEIVLCGERRVRVRGTRWDRELQDLVASNPFGWVETSMLVNMETGELQMRKVGDGPKPKQIPKFAEQRKEKLRVDPIYKAGLDMTATPYGMRIDKIKDIPGQDGLKVNDHIFTINGAKLSGQGSEKAMAEIFGANFKDGVILEVCLQVGVQDEIS